MRKRLESTTRGKSTTFPNLFYTKIKDSGLTNREIAILLGASPCRLRNLLSGDCFMDAHEFKFFKNFNGKE